MSLNDQRSIAQIQDVKTPLQINEALRKLNAAINKLEGRQGQILFRDGFSSESSTQTAAQFDSEILASSDFGIYFAGVEGTDCWLASGAFLAPSSEWVATKTRAVFFKFDNITGGQIYFNTGLTIGASFIPTLQSSGTLTPIWGEWGQAGDDAGGGPYVWNNEVQGNVAYFNRILGNTTIQILTSGYYQIFASVVGESDGGGGAEQVQQALNINGATVAGGFSQFPLAVGTYQTSHSFESTRFLTALDQVTVELTLGLNKIGTGSFDSLLTIKLLQS